MTTHASRSLPSISAWQPTADEDGSDGVEIESVVPKAIEYAWRAGDSAAQSLAYEEAARLYRMALAALDIEPRGDARARLDVLQALGDVEGRAGNFDAARSAFLDAAVIARSTGDGVGMARAALGVGGRIPWARTGHDCAIGAAPSGRPGLARRR